MKPVRSLVRTPSPTRSSPQRSPRSRRSEMDRTVRNQVRAPSSSSSPNRRKLPNPETQRKLDSRRVSMSPVYSLKASPRRNAYATGGSPRFRKNMERKAEDESSTVSDNSFSTSSYPDTEDAMQRYRMEEYKEGKDLLDRCDKLLNSIAEITAANELQPSPVSVLDSFFL